MSTIVLDFPRCQSKKMTFDVLNHNRPSNDKNVPFYHNEIELFVVCRSCHKASIAQVRQRNEDPNGVNGNTSNFASIPTSLDDRVLKQGFVTIKDATALPPPDHLPTDLGRVFGEGSLCAAVNCNNAAVAMYRLCLDLATKPLLPPESESKPDSYTRRNLKPRLKWLFDAGKLPPEIEPFSDCIREDGNDGAHDGSIGPADAEDVNVFTRLVLERLYTFPKKLELAQTRRTTRRTSSK